MPWEGRSPLKGRSPYPPQNSDPPPPHTDTDTVAGYSQQAGGTHPTGMHPCHFRLLPESPRWLLMKGRHKEAVSIMCRMAKANGHHLPEDITLTLMTDIKVSICFYVFMLIPFHVNKDKYKRH